MDVEDEKLTIDDISFEGLEDPNPEVSVADELDDPAGGAPDPEEEEEEEETSKKKKTSSQEEDEDIDDPEGEDEDEGDEPDPDGDDPDGDDEPEERVIDSVVKRLGLEFDEDELASLEDSEEGIANLVESASKKAAQLEYDRMVEASPNVKALYEYEQGGGDPQEFIQAFYPPTDYNQVEISEDDADTQKAIIRESLKAKGLSDERVNRNLQAIEDSGNLLEESQDSLKDLQQMQEDQRAQIKQQNEERQKQAKQQAEETNAKVNSLIEEGEINGLPIPKAKKQDFKKFITPDSETGQSPRDKRIAEMSLEDSLAVDLILMYGFDGLNQLIDRKANSKANGSLRDKLKSAKNRSKNSAQDPAVENGQSSVEDLEFRID